MSEDARYCYSVGCTWHGPIDAVGSTDSEKLKIPGLPKGYSLPCCPHCGSVLFETESEQEWKDAVKAAEDGGAVNYVAFIEWLRDCGRCFENYELAFPTFTENSGMRATLGEGKQ